MEKLYLDIIHRLKIELMIWRIVAGVLAFVTVISFLW